MRALCVIMAFTRKSTTKYPTPSRRAIIAASDRLASRGGRGFKDGYIYADVKAGRLGFLAAFNTEGTTAVAVLTILQASWNPLSHMVCGCMLIIIVTEAKSSATTNILLYTSLSELLSRQCCYNRIIPAAALTNSSSS